MVAMSDAQGLNPPRVLVADDDPAIVDAISILLEDEGYAVAVVVTGDVVQEIRREQPDVVLLDIWMSGQDGRDVCRRLKDDDATREIPVIVFSANPAVAQLAQDAGADDSLAKPFDLDDLLEKVARFSRRSGSGCRS